MLELTSNPRPEQMQPQGVQRLTDSDAAEVLDFLSRRPLNTFIMASFIRENGITSPAHRGEFYAYRNAFGALEGVALIGHLILLETNSDMAMKACAWPPSLILIWWFRCTRNWLLKKAALILWKKIRTVFAKDAPGELKRAGFGSSPRTTSCSSKLTSRLRLL